MLLDMIYTRKLGQINSACCQAFASFVGLLARVEMLDRANSKS